MIPGIAASSLPAAADGTASTSSGTFRARPLRSEGPRRRSLPAGLLALWFVCHSAALATAVVITGWFWWAEQPQTVCAAPPTAADALQLLNPDVNAIAVIDTAALYASPIARQQQWAQKAATAFLQRDAIVPPGAQRVTLAAELMLSAPFTALREYAIIDHEEPTSLKRMASLGMGELSDLDGTSTLLTDTGGFVASLSDRRWFFVAPSNRQSGRRLLSSLQRGQTSGPSDWLKTVAATPRRGQLWMAIELQDSITRAEIALALRNSPTLGKLTNVGRDAILDVLGSIRGCWIEVQAETTLEGRLIFDFARPAAVLQQHAPALLPEVLNELGASLDDVADWKAAAAGPQLTLAGAISPGTVRRLLSLFRGAEVPQRGGNPDGSSPGTTGSSSDPNAAPPEATRQEIIAASQRYLRSIDTLLDDLRKTLRNTRDNHALWFEKYGRRIDDLPRKDVDDELLDFGQRVSRSLRYQSQATRMARVQAGTREAQSGANRFYRTYGEVWTGPYSFVPVTGTVSPGDPSAIRAEENQQAQAVRFSEWKQIEDGLAAVRTTLTKRYRAEF